MSKFSGKHADVKAYRAELRRAERAETLRRRDVRRVKYETREAA